MTTQCDKILRHMNDYGSITLASRITDLRGMGYDIISETAKGKNRYGETTHYSVYRLGGK